MTEPTKRLNHPVPPMNLGPTPQALLSGLDVTTATGRKGVVALRKRPEAAEATRALEQLSTVEAMATSGGIPAMDRTGALKRGSCKGPQDESDVECHLDSSRS